MRLTYLGNRVALATLAVAWATLAGCHSHPYIDQTKTVPHDEQGALAKEDREIQQAAFINDGPPPIPRIDPPRTPSNPEAQEIWPLTLQEAIRIGLDNSEVVRVISLGAQGIPVGGFEPTPLQTGPSSQLGAGTLSTVYDPALQEVGIARSLATFDAQFTTDMFWNHNSAPFNNAIAAGTFVQGARFPVVFNSDTYALTSSLTKKTATGSVIGITHNMTNLWSNSPLNVFPSAWTTSTQLQFKQPLLGGNPQAVQNAVGSLGSGGGGITANQENLQFQGIGSTPTPMAGLSGLEANRAIVVAARLNADNAVWRFKAEIMALVRSVEQQYWALSQQQVQLWSRETAVELGEEILRRERAKLEVGKGKLADVAEAEEQLERFRLDLVTATADVITTERQLRNILGLKPADNRRIIPVTAPSEARMVPDWDSSFAQMLAYHPDVVSYQLFVRLAELQVLLARNALLPQLDFSVLYQFNGLGHSLDKAESVMTGAQLLSLDPLKSLQQRNAGINSSPTLNSAFQGWQVGFAFNMPLGFRSALAFTRQQQYALLRQRAFLQQIVHQTTHSLNRFFLEVDSNYTQFKTAGRLRAAAAQRLEAQRAYYEVGEITIDRYLDALSRWANAVALEAQFKTSYNTSIAALEEAKGTLLAYDNIALAEGPYPRKAYIQAHDQQAGHGRLPIPPDGPYHPMPVTRPPVADPIFPMESPDSPPPSPLPPLPFPVGPLGHPGLPTAPTVPAGDPTPLSHWGPRPSEPNVIPASATVVNPAPAAADGPIDVDLLPPLPH